MKIVNIEKIGKGDVYDITVKNKNSYTLFNGVKSHNTGGMYSSDTLTKNAKNYFCIAIFFSMRMQFI